MYDLSKVMMYMIVAVSGLGILLSRRYMKIFGEAELGGPRLPKFASAAFLFALYALFLLAISLNAYGIMPNPFS